MRPFALLLCLSILHLKLYPAVRHVPGDYPDIQTAVDAAMDGDTVLLADGIYTGPGNRGIQWDASHKHLVIMSRSGRDHCTIDCEGQDRAFLLNQGQDDRDVIDGITIRRGRFHGPGGAILLVRTSPEILDCLFDENRAHCVDQDNYTGGGAIAVYDSAAPVIRGNIFSNNTTCASGGAIRYDRWASGVLENNIIEGNISEYGGGGGISVSQFSNPLIINNLIIHNYSDSYFDGGFGGGIGTSHSAARIVNNTIAYNRTGNPYIQGKGGGLAVTKWEPFPLVRNCIIWYNTSAIDYMNLEFDRHEWMDISYCNVEEDLGHIFDLEPHTNIDSPPGFVNPDQGDFHLLPVSPSINTGTPDTSGLHLPSADLAESLRIVDGRIDMGSYEYQQVLHLERTIQDERFRIYPNPGTGYYTLDCLQGSRGDYMILITGLKGEKIQEIPLIAGRRRISIDIPEHPGGIYFLTVYGRGRLVYRQKLIKLE